MLTVDLVEFDPPGTVGLRLFGGQANQGLAYDGGAVSAFGQAAVAAPLPISMALVIDSGKLFGLYSTNGGAAWSVLPPAVGEPIAGALMTDAIVTLTVAGGGTARFDNFNTHPATPSVLTAQ